MTLKSFALLTFVIDYRLEGKEKEEKITRRKGLKRVSLSHKVFNRKGKEKCDSTALKGFTVFSRFVKN